MKKIFALLVLSTPLWGTTYCVSNTGSDAAAGTATGALCTGTVSAWQTIAHVNAHTFSAGDVILFQRGGTWLEQLTPGQSGTSVAPITFSSYGTGSRPMITGSNTISSWTSEAQGGGSVNVGDTTTVTNTETWIANYQYFYPVTFATGGTVTSESIYVAGTTCATTKVALYTDSGSSTPSTLVASSTSNALAQTANSWNQYTFATNPTVSAGNYWLAWLGSCPSSIGVAGGSVGVRYQSESYGSGFVATTGTLGGPYMQNVGWYAVLSSAGSTAYYATSSSDPVQVLEDSSRLNVVASKSLLGVGTFWFDSPNSRVYIRTKEDASPSGHTLEVGARDMAIYINAVKYINLSNLALRAARIYGIYATGGEISGLTVTNVDSSYNFSIGLRIVEGTATDINVLVSSSSFTYNGASGFESVVPLQTGWKILNNSFDHNGQIFSVAGGYWWNTDYTFSGGLKMGCMSGGSPWVAHSGPLLVSGNSATNGASDYTNGVTTSAQGVGIWSDMCNSVTIQGNYTSGNFGPGIQLEKNNNSNVVYNISNNDGVFGVITANDSYGIGGIHVRVGEDLGASNNLIANNTVYGGWWGIDVLSVDSRIVSTTTVRNNIAVSAVSHNLWVGPGGNNDGTHGTGNVYDHNAFGAPGSTLGYWTGTGAVSTYAALDTAYGSAMNNVQTDPLLTNPSSSIFTLKSTSPVRNAALAISGISQQVSEFKPDMGASEYTPGYLGSASVGTLKNRYQISVSQ